MLDTQFCNSQQFSYADARSVSFPDVYIWGVKESLLSTGIAGRPLCCRAGARGVLESEKAEKFGYGVWW